MATRVPRFTDLGSSSGMCVPRGIISAAAVADTRSRDTSGTTRQNRDSVSAASRSPRGHGHEWNGHVPRHDSDAAQNLLRLSIWTRGTRVRVASSLHEAFSCLARVRRECRSYTMPIAPAASPLALSICQAPSQKIVSTAYLQIRRRRPSCPKETLRSPRCAPRTNEETIQSHRLPAKFTSLGRSSRRVSGRCFSLGDHRFTLQHFRSAADAARKQRASD